MSGKVDAASAASDLLAHIGRHAGPEAAFHPHHTFIPSARNRSVSGRMTALSFALWLRKTPVGPVATRRNFAWERIKRGARPLP